MRAVAVMRSFLIYLSALLSIVLNAPVGSMADAAAADQVPAGAQTTPSCTDPILAKAAENAKVSVVPDPKTAWQPRGGTVKFTVSGNNVSLDGVKVIVCFGWPADNWKDTKTPWEGYGIHGIS